MDYLGVSICLLLSVMLSKSSSIPRPGDGSDWERNQRQEALGLSAIEESERFKADIAANLLGMNPPPPSRRVTTDVPEIISKIYVSSINRTTGSPLSRRSAFKGEVDLVRGLQDLYDVNTQIRMRYRFDTAHINSTEDIIEAEFHVYKRTLRQASNPIIHDVQIELYKVEHNNWTLQGSQSFGLHLIDRKTLSAHADEWVPFKGLKEVVKHWINNPHTNKGLLLRAIDPISHDHVNSSHIDFVQKGEHPAEKQPVLVLFSDKVRKKQGKARRKTREAIRMQINSLLNEKEQHRSRHDTLDPSADTYLLNRKRRDIYQSKPSENTRPVSDEGGPTHCRKKEMFVSIQALGWNNWILYPEWLTVNSCVGTCRYPPGNNIPHTNHAILLSLVHHFEPDKVKAPCCVPNQLTSLSILYRDSNEAITIKQYDNMHVSSCGCR